MFSNGCYTDTTNGNSDEKQEMKNDDVITRTRITRRKIVEETEMKIEITPARALKEKVDETTLLFIGNPGVGKSTLINSIMRKVQFRAGVSLGAGLTKNFDIVNFKAPDGQEFRIADTVGLSDVELRKEAAASIKEGLSSGGRFRIFFVCVLMNGRIQCQDKTTMKLVLESCPDIKANKYGIVLNQVRKAELKKLNKPGATQRLYEQLLAGIEPQTKHISYVENDYDVEGEDDKLLPLNENLRKFFLGPSEMDCKIDESNVELIKTEDWKGQINEMEQILKNVEKKQKAEAERHEKLLKAAVEKHKALENDVEPMKRQLMKMKQESIKSQEKQEQSIEKLLVKSEFEKLRLEAANPALRGDMYCDPKFAEIRAKEKDRSKKFQQDRQVLSRLAKGRGAFSGLNAKQREYLEQLNKPHPSKMIVKYHHGCLVSSNWKLAKNIIWGVVTVGMSAMHGGSDGNLMSNKKWSCCGKSGSDAEGCSTYCKICFRDTKLFPTGCFFDCECAMK